MITRGNDVVKIKTLLVCIAVSFIVGAITTGGGVYLYLRDAVERGAEAQQLAEDRAIEITTELGKLQTDYNDIEKKYAKYIERLENYEREFGGNGKQIETIIDYNKRIEDILRSGKILE
jgi:Na+-transporting NADH:ubiquinone oxidoreductase subunit NqrC